ncbi:MAG: bifunctional riboflavin kinase/FAD synthetase [Campylobacterota bacterium]|nr:bifunctional riboflavin kinase/FAD synthetase [Campylobacterota bacterium]
MVLYQTNLKGKVIKDTITSIAIGGFDGMHLAHQQLFSKLNNNGAIVVISTEYANLSPNANRSLHTKFPLFYYPLENIKHLSGEQFIKLLYEEFPNLKKIVVGYDFHFGYKAAYSIENLKELFDGEVIVVDEYKIDNIAVHSRVIRSYLRDSKLEDANKLLGYEYRIKGTHIRGQGIGSKQFVATINIDVKEFLIPSEGIYITKTILQNKSYNSVTFIGHRVTTDGKFAVETHIIDNNFNEIIPNNIDIVFYKKTRDNKKFETYEELKQEILNDIIQAKEWFKVGDKS